METTTDRSDIPKLDENLIQSSELRYTWIAALIVAAVPVLASVFGGPLPKFDDLPDSSGVIKGLVGLGIYVALAASIVSIGLIVAADHRARAAVTSANLALRALPHMVTVSPSAQTPAEKLTPGSQGLWVEAAGEGSKPFLVVTARYRDNKTQFLLARGDETPVWKEQSEITSWHLGSER